jgi:hypothetical protein
MMGGFLNISLNILSFLVKYISRPQLVDIFNREYKHISLNEQKYLNQTY